MSEPYYADGAVTLHHGDAFDILPTIRPGTVNGVVTDPPYILHAGSAGTGASKVGGWADMMNAAHWYTSWYKQARRILRHDGSLWTLGNWRTLPAMQRAAIDAELPATSLAVWDKEWIGPAGPQALRSQHEFCLILAKPGYKIENRSQGDVIRVPTSSHKPNGHPAEKPVLLMERLIELATPRPGLVVDPFCGSGTTLLAARRLGHHVVGIEAEERWCELAAKRLTQGVLEVAP